MIKESSIQEIFSKVDIVDIISKHLDLKKNGANYICCCPFHEEKTPSFSVSPVKGIYKCFGCGKSGGAVMFLMEKDRLTFPEAIEKLAAELNIILEYENDDRTSVEKQIDKDKYAGALSLITTTAKQYERTLYNKANGDCVFVLEYLLKERRLKPETLIEWQIGFAPTKNFVSQDILQTNKYSLAESVGIVRSNDDQVNDVLQHRITFPIQDHRGSIIGIAGRKLATDKNEKKQKYINPKESFVYNKSNVLYGLNRAIAAKAFDKHKRAILVEGYLDVISMHQAGYENTISTSGTSLTKDQAKLLKRFTDTVIIMRDADKPGREAASRDIDILAAIGFKIYICKLPEGEDPDSFSYNSGFKKFMETDENFKDAMFDKIGQIFLTVTKDELGTATALEEVAKLIALIQNETTRDVYIAKICDQYKLKNKLKTVVEKTIKNLIAKKREDERVKLKPLIAPGDNLPAWVCREDLMNNGFVQLESETNSFKVGIYFKTTEDSIKRVTNFTIKPLYHIYDRSNNRRLVKVWNGKISADIEMPTNAFTEMGKFQLTLMEQGSFSIEPSFKKEHFLTIANWCTDNMPLCYELKTLGWQTNESFFAYSNKIAIPTESGCDLLDFDDLGIVEIKGKFYISMGVSSSSKDIRSDDNMYENDLYLSYKKSPITFEQWCELFHKVYGLNSQFGIAYLIMTTFKDIVTKTTKFPLFYAYGPKGSGKSDECESLLWFCFSGKNSDGKLIQGYNLNRGQGTPFSFFNLQSRYRNVILHFNEFDENNIDDHVFGSFKSFYDGQGREVGDGGTGKTRKTTIQKTNGGNVIAGQYLSTKDDGSVLSRAITCQFDLSRMENISVEQIDAHKLLKKYENDGLSSLICDLLVHRGYFEKQFSKIFWEEYQKMKDDLRTNYGNVEERILKNYTTCLATIKLMGEKFKFPFDYNDFYNQCITQIINHNALLKDNNSINNFWKGVETLFDKKFINWNNKQDLSTELEFRIVTTSSIPIKRENNISDRKWERPKKLLLIRFPLLYSAYSKYHRERTGKPCQDESSMLKYLQDQPYYIGLCNSYRFDDKTTSCYVIDYEKAELQLELNFHPENNHKQLSDSCTEDLPF